MTPFDTDDIRIRELKKLITPAALLEEFPITDEAARLVIETRAAAESIIKGEDDRLLVIVGPCSIHDPMAAVEYAHHLAEARGKYADDLVLVMRVYFEKPRTTVGWKGLINDPDMDHSFDINRGLGIARKLLLDLLAAGVPAGSEFLETISPQYIADLISWGAIGARTTESQVHRELVSGISAPVGFKNGTGGNVQICIDAIKATRMPHNFLGVTKTGESAIVSTWGNDACHIILRGANTGPNYDAESVAEVIAKLNAADLPPHIMIDCSHGNSQKDYRRQSAVADDLCRQVADGSRSVAAVMIESNLVEGNQSVEPGKDLVHGQSITDSCVSWQTTEPMLEGLAKAVRRRRGGMP
jgi:3-deoxy-7-phosphoheptulonate synthase